VRTWVGVALVTVCLGLTGCSLFGKKQAAPNNNPKPFTGSETPAAPRETAGVSDPEAPLPGANGLLAGQVVDSGTGRPVKVFIEVKDIIEDDASKAARLEVETKEDGYFTILKVKPGHHYRLIARTGEGKELASGMVVTRAPNPHLLIRIDKKLTTPDTPPVPDPPKLPGKKAAPATESSQDRTPAASLDPPVKFHDREPASTREGDLNPPSGNSMGATGNGNPPNIANIADEPFHRAPTSPSASIPGQQQHRSLPPPPQWEGVQEERPVQPAPSPIVPSPPSSVRVPNTQTRVPSCVLLGNKLENFALNDLNGQRWEYKQDRKGRLVLIDFWYSTCPACKHAIPRLVELQKNYGLYGLQVIGIASETGTFDEQVEHVRGVRGRYSINYLTLLSGGGHDSCPVVRQFGVKLYPTLVLLDSSGMIIWSAYNGMDDYAWETLERLISKKLLQQR
jgi:thiol-disulfide isomerase/thioredoxin